MSPLPSVTCCKARVVEPSPACPRPESSTNHALSNRYILPSPVSSAAGCLLRRLTTAIYHNVSDWDPINGGYARLTTASASPSPDLCAGAGGDNAPGQFAKRGERFV